MTPDPPIVYVVDDDHRMRQALANLVSSLGLRVATFDSATAFLETEKTDAPSCLVLDLRLGSTSGLEVQKQLATGISPPIIFVTGHGDIPSSVRAMKAGAIDFLTKPFSDAELLQAIELGIAKDCKARVERRELTDLRRRYKLLTPRERQVLPYVTTGLLNKQTAHQLGTAEITVRVHRREIMRKMQAQSLAELVRMSCTLDLL
ncbi:MAG TPA: response regulator [Bryobacteraceae bacterium]|jgi:FixJ family two-component response regulator|nr:response regulator [Bryobacteraceae bacterium]